MKETEHYRNGKKITHQFFITLRALNCLKQWLFNYEDSQGFYKEWKSQGSTTENTFSLAL